MADIFISYAREDEARIKELVSTIEEYGWSVFWDRRIPAGETWRSYIGKALDEARCVIVAWSKHSVTSTWVIEEADDAKQRNLLIPVLLDPVEQPRGFREIQAADLADWRPGSGSPRFDELIKDIRLRMGSFPRPPKEAPAPEPSAGKKTLTGKIEPGVPVASSKHKVIVVAAIMLVLLIVAVYLSFRGRQDRRPVERATPGTETSRERIPGSLPGRASHDKKWLVIVGSFPKRNRPAAEERLRALMNTGYEADLIDTDKYPNLRPGLWAVVLGPYESEAQALEAKDKVRRVMPESYVKPGW